jgi:hypothetical protein
VNARLGAFVATLVVVVACSSFEEGQPDPVAPDRDAGTPDGPSDPCAERVLYVSNAAGNDANDGCTKERAIKSIGAAMALAKMKQLDGVDIRVCQGVYAEQALAVTSRMQLHAVTTATPGRLAPRTSRASRTRRIPARRRRSPSRARRSDATSSSRAS